MRVDPGSRTMHALCSMMVLVVAQAVGVVVRGRVECMAVTQTAASLVVSSWSHMHACLTGLSRKACLT